MLHPPFMFHVQVNIQCFTLHFPHPVLHSPFLFHVQVNIQCFSHPPFMFHVQVLIQCFTHPPFMFRLIFSASPTHPSCSISRLIFSASPTHPSCSMFRLIFSASLTLMLHIFFLFSASLSHPSYVPCPGFSYSYASFALRIFHVHVLSQCFTHPPFICVFHIQVPIHIIIHSPLYMFMFQFRASHRSYIIKIKINLKDCVYYISAKNKGGKKSLLIKTFQNNQH